MPHNRHVTTSALSRLRALVPQRTLQIEEALRIAELQATHLLMIHDITTPPVPEEVILALPKLRLEYVETPVSGACYWDGREWVIEVNTRERYTRQRFVTAHEFKHILDHGHTHHLYAPGNCSHHLDHAEYAADYFAGCLLVPRVLLKRAYGDGLQTHHELAALFQVSERSIDVRLKQVGLIDTAPRCMQRNQQSARHLSTLIRQKGGQYEHSE